MFGINEVANVVLLKMLCSAIFKVCRVRDNFFKICHVRNGLEKKIVIFGLIIKAMFGMKVSIKSCCHVLS